MIGKSKRCLVALPIIIYVPLVALAQHDPGRNAVRLLVSGQTEAAVAVANQAPEKNLSPINDAERHFVLAMVACRKGDLAAAFREAKQAVELGLPVERLQAGPREVLVPLHTQNGFREWMRDRQKQLLHGPLLGAVTDTSARFWVRTATESEVRIEVVRHQESTPESLPFTGKSRTSEQADHTAVVQVNGLSPEVTYRYKVFLGGKEVGEPAVFRTYPRPASATRFRIGFGGGAGWTPKHERMWTTIAQQDLLAFLFLGDNVYIDDPTHGATQRYCYYRRQSQVEWRRLTATVSVYSVYDDHDFGDNDCVPGPHVDDPPWKRSVLEVFR